VAYEFVPCKKCGLGEEGECCIDAVEEQAEAHEFVPCKKCGLGEEGDCCRDPSEEQSGDMVDDEQDEPFVTCVVVRNKETFACKGYCFLGFPSSESAEKAMMVLNSGVIVCGSTVQAQVSQPKDRFAKKTEEDDHDLRLRRQRYQVGSKKKQHGHVTCSRNTITGKVNVTIATNTGAMNAVVGTRGGKLEVFENDKKSTLSGFAHQK